MGLLACGSFGLSRGSVVEPQTATRLSSPHARASCGQVSQDSHDKQNTSATHEPLTLEHSCVRVCSGWAVGSGAVPRGALLGGDAVQGEGVSRHHVHAGQAQRAAPVPAAPVHALPSQAAALPRHARSGMAILVTHGPLPRGKKAVGNSKKLNHLVCPFTCSPTSHVGSMFDEDRNDENMLKIPVV